MKSFKLSLLLLVFVFIAGRSYSQIPKSLKKAVQRTEKRAERRTEKNVNKKIDKGIDNAFDGNKKEKKKKEAQTPVDSTKSTSLYINKKDHEITFS